MYIIYKTFILFNYLFIYVKWSLW